MWIHRTFPSGSLLICALTACSGVNEPSEDTSVSSQPPEWCDGSTEHQWSPSSATEVEFFPDGLMEAPAPDSPTGIRLDPSRVEWTSHVPSLLQDAVSAVETLSGFGTNGGLLVRFSDPVTDLPSTAAESIESNGWRLIDLGDGEGTRVPFEAEVLEEGKTIRIWPLRPLRKGVQHALIVTNDARDASGGCIAPAATTRDLLWGSPSDAAVAEASGRYRDAVEQVGVSAGDISVLSVFTTHDDIGQLRSLAAQEALEPVQWTSEPDCQEEDSRVVCTLTMTVRDFRNDAGLVDASLEPTEAEIPLTIWLPDLEGPHPVVMYGHGLGSRRSEGRYVASEMDTTPYALVAMEAVGHGDHPSAADSENTEPALDFLGVSLTPPSVRAGAMRGNFDQTTLDRLRLLRLLREQPDIDGDGQAELDPERVSYLGISLGAILGPQLLTLDGGLDGAVLSVGGARLMSIVTESDTLRDFEDLIAALVGSKENFDRLVTVAQHIVDPVDPGTWSPHVLHDRLDDAPAPSVLVQVGLSDEVVPPASGHALARALDVPHLEPVAEPVELLETIAEAPVIANGPDSSTVALFQFDEVTRNGSVGPAYHVATPTSDEGRLQLLTFLRSWTESGIAEVVNPYDETGSR